MRVNMTYCYDPCHATHLRITSISGNEEFHFGSSFDILMFLEIHTSLYVRDLNFCGWTNMYVHSSHPPFEKNIYTIVRSFLVVSDA